VTDRLYSRHRADTDVNQSTRRADHQRHKTGVDIGEQLRGS